MQSKAVVINLFWSFYYLSCKSVIFLQCYFCFRESKKMAHLLENTVAGTKLAKLTGG